MEPLPYVIRAPGTSKQLAIDPECQADPFYRYVTHQLVVAFQGKYAVLTNLELVAKDLQTSADYVATYLATSLNATIKRPAAKQRAGASTASWTLYPATFTLDKVNVSFRYFLTSFVLCPLCSLPELINVVEQPSRPDSPPPPPPCDGSSASSSPPKVGVTSEQKPPRKSSAASNKKKVRVRCQSCRWNETLEKSLGRVKKNPKFVDYVLAHPPQESSPTLACE